MRRSFALCVMPEYVDLLIGEPQHRRLADTLKSLKQSVSRQLMGEAEYFWQNRDYDFNFRNQRQFAQKLGYIHRVPVKRGLCGRPEGWRGAVFAITQLELKAAWRLNPSGAQESANGSWETMSASGTARLKPKQGLSGPPARLQLRACHRPTGQNPVFNLPGVAGRQRAGLATDWRRSAQNRRTTDQYRTSMSANA